MCLDCYEYKHIRHYRFCHLIFDAMHRSASHRQVRSVDMGVASSLHIDFPLDLTRDLVKTEAGPPMYSTTTVSLLGEETVVAPRIPFPRRLFQRLRVIFISNIISVYIIRLN